MQAVSIVYVLRLVTSMFAMIGSLLLHVLTSLFIFLKQIKMYFAISVDYFKCLKFNLIYYAYLCFRFVDYIAEDLQDEVRGRIDGSRYLSVMVDAATDCSAEELDLVYVRHLQDGDIRNTYLGIGQLASASAIGHKESMEETFRAAQVDWKAKTLGLDRMAPV